MSEETSKVKNYENEDNEGNSNKDIDENDDNLPSWMRYLPKTPWNSKEIHQKLHTQESLTEIQKRKIRKRIIRHVPRSSNPFHVDLTHLKQKRKSDNQPNGEDYSDNNDAGEYERRSKRARSTRDGKQSSIDEMSMLVSFCKVQKDI